MTPGTACASTAVPMRGHAPEALDGSILGQPQNLGCVALYMEDTWGFSLTYWHLNSWMVSNAKNPNMDDLELPGFEETSTHTYLACLQNDG